jgi:hypothetical protein
MFLTFRTKFQTKKSRGKIIETNFQEIKTIFLDKEQSFQPSEQIFKTTFLK